MAGWKLKDIAWVYGCTVLLISNTLKSNGFEKFLKSNRQFDTENYQRWDEIDLARLRKYCKRGYSLELIYEKFPNRSLKAIKNRVKKMTRYWYRKYTLDAIAKAKKEDEK